MTKKSAGKRSGITMTRKVGESVCTPDARVIIDDIHRERVKLRIVVLPETDVLRGETLEARESGRLENYPDGQPLPPPPKESRRKKSQ